VALVVELVGTGASWRSSRMERWHYRRTGAAAHNSGDSGGGTRFWTESGFAVLRHSGEAGDGFESSGEWRLNRRCRLRTAEMAAGRRFMAWARTRLCQPSAARGTLGGDNALTSGPGARREKLIGGTPRQILF
jgi:hypothetical protein